MASRAISAIRIFTGHGRRRRDRCQSAWRSSIFSGSFVDIQKSPLEACPRFLETVPRSKSGDLFPRDRARFEQGEDPRVVLSSAHAQGNDGQMGRTDDAKRHPVEIGRFCLLQSFGGQCVEYRDERSLSTRMRQSLHEFSVGAPPQSLAAWVG